MKLSKTLRFTLVGALALGLVTLAGCAVKGGTADEGDANSPNNTDDTVSTALVAYANGDDVLFIDQETQTPYIPTNLDNATITFEGQEIDEDDLQAGNIVKVTGDNIMLESYPGQYPGITAVEVTEVGNPADAEQYADIVDTVFAAPDPAEVPVGSLDYKTAEAQVSVVLNPYSYEWSFDQADGTPDLVAQDGDFKNVDGTLLDGVADARIPAATDAFVAFSVNPTAVEVERTPLISGKTAVDPAAEDEKVTCTVGADGTLALTIEPGYLYELSADFTQGEADYAFYTVS